MKANKNLRYKDPEQSHLIQELGAIAFQNNIPLFTTIELSQDCNFRCGHCYNFDRLSSPKNPSDRPPLSFEEFKNVIDQVMQEGAFSICFTGGEVFLYSHLWDLVDHVVKKSGLVKLKSNASFIDIDLAHKILNHRVSSLEISLYGFSDESYEKFTMQKKMFSKVSNALKHLKDYGINITLNIILHRFNFHELESMILFAQELDAPFNFSDEMTKRYDGTDSSLDFNLTDDQLKQLLAGPYAHYFQINHDLKNHSFQCACARNVCGISYYGDVFPCIGAPIKAGNIKDTTFRSIWQTSDLFKEIRSITNESFKECIKCDVAQYCNRSSGSTYINTQNYYGCDPQSKKMAQLRKSYMFK